MSEEKYANWFARRRETNVMDGVKEHILKIVDTAEELNKSFTAIMEKDEMAALQAISRLNMNEKAADNIEVSLNEQLAIGDLPAKEREDLMHLVRRMDQIADWTKSAARNIEVLIEAEIEVPEKIWKYYRVLAGRVLNTAKEVKLCIDFLGEDDDQFKVHKGNVERIEHEIDDLYFKIKKKVLLSDDIDPRMIFILRDIVHALENAADSCKAAADLMQIIMVAHK
ncbi:MAG: DUF47 family protein [Thermoplasmata archaeon]|nr:DUF47 family protein [Thermoplasmata archaeon]